MQKRAGIARATVFRPKIRLYDEPTAGLDPVTSARILALIRQLHDDDPGGVTVVVSNEMATLLKSVPRALMLFQGELIFDGPVSDLEPEGRAPSLTRQFVSGAVEAEL
jgi:phospholipid/cholesterol/gamma-HCH transport system ATP-binding protein